jgi:hypothetical protein
VADCVVPVEGVVGVGGWVVWLRRCGRRRRGKCPVDAAIVLWVGQGYSRRTVVLRVVLLLGLGRGLLLRWVAVAAAVCGRRGRRCLVHLRGVGPAHEQLVVLALRVAVAPGGRVAIPGGAAVGLLPIISAWRPASVGVLVLCWRAVVGVGYAGVVVVLAVPVVRHGAGAGAVGSLGGFGRRDGGAVGSLSGFGRRDGWCGVRSMSLSISSFTLPGEVARAA